jgi:hypothetical protein
LHRAIGLAGRTMRQEFLDARALQQSAFAVSARATRAILDLGENAMYRNVLGEKVSRKRHREMLAAARNRRELIAAGLGRRELLKMGLLSSAGMLLPIAGLSSRASAQQRVADLCKPAAPGNQLPSPPTGAFVRPLPILPIAQPVAAR